MSTIISLILSVFLVCIALFAMLAVLKVQDSAAGTEALVFSSINFFILIVIIGFGKNIASAIGARYPAICLSTIIYTVINLAFNFAACNMDSTVLFTLVNLIIIFIYLSVTLPILVFGIGRENSNDDEIKEHNIRR